MWRLASSLLHSVLEAIRHDPELRRLIDAHPRFWDWLARRFNRSEAFGLRLTVGVALAFVFLFSFLSVVQDLIANEAIVLTYLGNWQVVTAGASLLMVYLALTRR